MTAFTQLSPAVQVHLVAAVGALVLGPVALRARKGTPMHRGAGYAWVLLMLGAALSSVFIRDFRLPNLAGYTPIHLFTVLTIVGVAAGIAAAVRRRIALHRRVMWQVYLGGCIGAGLFALAPSRFLGQWLWQPFIA